MRDGALFREIISYSGAKAVIGKNAIWKVQKYATANLVIVEKYAYFVKLIVQKYAISLQTPSKVATISYSCEGGMLRRKVYDELLSWKRTKSRECLLLKGARQIGKTFIAREFGTYDVIASGSLLGLHYGQDADTEVEEVESIPVGYERQLVTHSLDFKEFLWGCGYTDEDMLYLKTFFDEKKLIPVEVKAGNTSTPSLNNFIAQFHPKYAIKLIDGNCGLSNQKITLPHFMAMFI